jgi:hypothetical protein
MLMNDDFVTHMEGAISTAPNENIARQLQTLLNRLRATGGVVPVLPGMESIDAPSGRE